MEQREITNKIRNYQESRRIQKSLKRYFICPTEFDVLIYLHHYNENWIHYEDLREKVDIKNKRYFSERGIISSLSKGYLEIKKRDANRKDVRITSLGKDLIERIFNED